MLKRKVDVFLKKWKENKNKKPLIIRGARQVGKTWLMKEFGNLHYENTVYIKDTDTTDVATVKEAISLLKM